MKRVFVVAVLSVVFLAGCRSRVAEDSASASATTEASGSSATDSSADDDAATWTATFDPDNAKPGDVVALNVVCHVADDWHIYSVKGPTGVSKPTKLSAILPAGLTSDANWVLPEPKMKPSIDGMVAIHTGEVQFSKQMLVADDAEDGEVVAACQIQFQVCKESGCLPPNKITIEVPLTINSK